MYGRPLLIIRYNIVFLPAHILYLVAFLLLEESLDTKKRSVREDSWSNHESDRTWNDTAALLEAKDSSISSSLQSGDSGIELSNGVKTIDPDINLPQPDTNDDDLIMMESDIDTDSDLETINSDTELLLETEGNSKNSDDSRAHLHSPRSFVSTISSCLVSECGPEQCYGRVRNSLVDSYDCVMVCVEYLKGCMHYCHGKQWTPGEVKGQAKATLRKVRHSALNLLRLILDRRVFLSTLLYALLAFFDVMCNEVSELIPR